MSLKQPEIDQVTKGDRRQRTGSVAGEQVSHIPMYKGLSGRRTPTPVKYATPRYDHKYIKLICYPYSIHFYLMTLNLPRIIFVSMIELILV
jgi:hypothetical protein